MIHIRSLEIGLTYRCNLKCNYCNRFVGVMKMPNTDMTPEEVVEAGRRLRDANIVVGKVKMSGGQPTMNPHFAEICKIVANEWPKQPIIQVLSNGTPVENPGVRRWHVRQSIIGKPLHIPFAVSPLDLGIQPEGIGYEKVCKSGQHLCGRYLDKFGFNFCPFAGVIGRVVWVDTYSAKPVLMGVKEICQHCMYGLVPRDRYRQLGADALAGKVPVMTETFREGLKRWNKAPKQLPYFLDRKE